MPPEKTPLKEPDVIGLIYDELNDVFRDNNIFEQTGKVKTAHENFVQAVFEPMETCSELHDLSNKILSLYSSVIAAERETAFRIGFHAAVRLYVRLLIYP